ncbi:MULTISPECIES: deoxynucleoside kinase [Pedobacter]|uniref:Deoxynucleoside kinase n=1 Tax=Pedobacter montanisoli TaxID=2923277 RepID=A0ABS9ZYR0_9SPHI|nr:deoxynucleoside kinase [Pedobacter montanisoli]MCJ0743442.1 deoxynucleoside kinase [Pedobacter montanisoli]
MHIAVVGNIGAGKTTLTGLLAKNYGWEALYEAVDNNPYLEDFYSDMKRWSFNLQIYFLNSRFQQIVEIEKLQRNVIQDRTIYEDAHIFAENLHEMGLMTTRDHDNYRAIFDNITSFIKAPDLLIYLRASVPTLVNNIQRRGREYEAGIRIDYLSKLNEKYEAWIKDYKLGKLLILDKDRLDFTNNPEDLGAVIQSIEAEIHGLF